MILLNFAHPLLPGHLRRVEELAGGQVEQVIEIACEIDTQRPLTPHVTALADACALTSTQWQTLPLLVNPPSLNYIALALLAEIHGRCGYFPTIVRLRPVPRSAPTRYEVAEVVNLQSARDDARQRRIEHRKEESKC